LLWLSVPLLNDGHSDGGVALVRGALIGPDAGHATLMRGPDDLRERIDVFQPGAPALAALSARIKDSFDPRGLLNPGRMYVAV